MILAFGNSWAGLGLIRRRGGIKKGRGLLVGTAIMGILLGGWRMLVEAGRVGVVGVLYGEGEE